MLLCGAELLLCGKLLAAKETNQAAEEKISNLERQVQAHVKGQKQVEVVHAELHAEISKMMALSQSEVSCCLGRWFLRVWSSSQFTQHTVKMVDSAQVKMIVL